MASSGDEQKPQVVGGLYAKTIVVRNFARKGAERTLWVRNVHLGDAATNSHG